MHIKTADGQMIIIDQSDTFTVSFCTCKLDECSMLKCLTEGGDEIPVLSSKHFSGVTVSEQEDFFNSACQMIMNRLLIENEAIDVRSIVENILITQNKKGEYDELY